MKIIQSILFCFMLFIAITSSFSQSLYAQTRQEEREILTEGIGRTTAEAAQNAAQNALTNIVGNFIDTNKVFEKRVEIKEGIRSETKSINANIKEYSQGSIRKFEILDVTKSQDGLVRLQARVVVRVEDFRAYIKKLAETNVKVDEGLFAQMKTEQKQNESLGSLLYDKVLLPIVEGEVVKFQAESPKPFSQANINENLKHSEEISDLLRTFGQAKIVVFKVNVFLDRNFVENINKIFISTAQNKYQFLTRNQVSRDQRYSASSSLAENLNQIVSTPGRMYETRYQPDILLAINQNDPANGESSMFDIYLFSGAKKDFTVKAPWAQALVSGYGTGNWNGRYETFMSDRRPTPAKKLTVEFTDGSGHVLQRDQTAGINSRDTRRLFVVNARPSVGKFSQPWSMVGALSYAGTTSPVIRGSHTMLLFVALEDETLEKAKSISIKLTN